MSFFDDRVPARVWGRLLPNPETGCWIWQGCVLSGGYGQLRSGEKRFFVHRFMFEAFNGPILDGLVIDHLCEVKLCANPAHLEAVTAAENTRRHFLVRHLRTHCPRGHEITDDNVYVMGGYRRCKVCHKEIMRRWYLSRREAA